MNQPTDPAADNAPTGADTRDTDAGDKATIGATVKINGDISGKEDLIINGSVEGNIDFREHSLHIGEKGQVRADVTAKIIHVDGEIRGELRGAEQVTIGSSGRVVGDISAPRVVLNDGCRFKGSVDMEGKSPLGVADSRHLQAKLAGARNFPDRPAPPGGNPLKPK